MKNGDIGEIYDVFEFNKAKYNCQPQGEVAEAQVEPASKMHIYTFKKVNTLKDVHQNVLGHLRAQELMIVQAPNQLSTNPTIIQEQKPQNKLNKGGQYKASQLDNNENYDRSFLEFPRFLDLNSESFSEDEYGVIQASSLMSYHKSSQDFTSLSEELPFKHTSIKI